MCKYNINSLSHRGTQLLNSCPLYVMSLDTEGLNLVAEHRVKGEGFAVKALWGRTQEEAEELAKEMNVPFYTNRIDDVLLHQDVDLVCINLPPPLTRQIAVKTLASLCERRLFLPTLRSSSSASLVLVQFCLFSAGQTIMNQRLIILSSSEHMLSTSGSRSFECSDRCRHQPDFRPLASAQSEADQ
ncbi:hypothetical protein XENOCAPTIV_004817 [Xenoophorus captivus]|uniref:Gfo/Idh/MocA-like oxidoreductase N-terminal domain-containing protein n=1 Tax=Xenoophorus captivus TaxID=1517983 RepID=A0ABV0QPY3_9TELE